MKLIKTMNLGMVRNGIEVMFNGNKAIVNRVSDFPGKDYSVTTVYTENGYIAVNNNVIVELSDREAWIQKKIYQDAKGVITSDYERGMAEAYRNVYDRIIGIL